MIPFVAQGTDQQLGPADAVCDFESALNDAVQRQFRMHCLMKRAIKWVKCEICQCCGVAGFPTLKPH
ncbi:hypothetical protein F441_06997, partial [Phytophthora nicotianae CJ01A1]